MMARDTVSVVIPTYNGADHVAQTIESVLAQSRAVVELIVVDDGSSDGTLQQVQRAAKPFHERVRLLHNQRQGVSSSRNVGLAAARGGWVCFLDQDDVWHPQHLESQFSLLSRSPGAGVIVSPYRHWYPRSGSEPPPHDDLGPQQQDWDPAFSGWVYHQFLLDCWALTSASTVRRNVLVDHGGFSTSLPFSEDWDLWLRLSREVPFLKVTGPAVIYRQHPVQGSRVLRHFDHRVALLESVARLHGLASRDGRQVPPRLFRTTVARYEMEFGYGQLLHGDAAIGVRSLIKAWRRDPMKWRYLALAAAGLVGWRPSGSDATPLTTKI
jgi:glycosyltransferase involved in cell wall biosynthesis